VSELLSGRTTLRLGGPAQRFVSGRTEEQLLETVIAADVAGEPLLVLGGGSNVVVADEGFPGLVLDVATTGVRAEADACGGAMVTVAAGEDWDELVARAVTEEWVGIEALAGIPGRVGASPIQNVGAYGQEVADTVARVRALDRRARRVRTLMASECGFGYRWSRFKAEPGRWLVLDVTFQLRLGTLGAPVRYAELARTLGVEIGSRASSGEVREAVLSLRRSKGMVLDETDHDTWSAGSFFTNPLVAPDEVPEGAPSWPLDADPSQVKTSAAWLIEHAGFGKGYVSQRGKGRVSLSTKHTLALTNRGGATTAELLELAREIRGGVAERFGITLVNEPVLVGCRL
jgi:UDP-N-acetylmuramate dehydrogenase